MLRYCVDIDEKFNEYFQNIVYRMHMTKKKKNLVGEICNHC